MWLNGRFMSEPEIKDYVEQELRRQELQRGICIGAESMGEELKTVMQKSEEEKAELRKEIARLKRELTELKQQEPCIPWISCEDEMPEPLEQVIGYFPKVKHWAVVGWNGIYWDSPSGFVRYTKNEISHWISVQKLPLRQIPDLKGDEF